MLTYLPNPQERVNAIKELIQEAKSNIVLQLYLFSANGELKTMLPVENTFPWARTLAQWLIDKKKQNPDITIIVILDSQTIEDASKTHVRFPPLTRHLLEAEGILVLTASLAETKFNTQRDFSKAARLHNEWLHPTQKRYFKGEWAGKQNYWQILHNVEDHRKNIVIDSGKAGILFSHNVIDIAYQWHENTFLLRGELSKKLWKLALESISNALALPIKFLPQDELLRYWLQKEKDLFHKDAEQVVQEDNGVEILESGPEILQAILKELEESPKKQVKEIIVASAYFSDLQTLFAIMNASKYAKVRILIDNCHALPLRPLTGYILQQTVNLLSIHNYRKVGKGEMRLYPSHPKDMMHCKAIAFLGKETQCLIAGQANFTPNSFSGAWLETSIKLHDDKIIEQFIFQFEELWKRSERVVPYGELSFFQWIRAKIHASIFLVLLKIAGWLGFKY